jgi:putative Holliday junction resolvase
MKVIGLDVGTKTIGVAVSDELGWTAQGVTTLMWDEANLNEGVKLISQLVTDFKAQKIVLGLPKNMDGSLGERAQKVKELAEKLKQELGVPIQLWDERLSTVAAEKILLAGDVSRKKRKKVIDKMAAGLILQNYLDSIN